MFYGVEFKVLKPMYFMYEKIGEGKYADEYFMAREKDGMLDYCIISDRFGQPSPANSLRCKTPYAIKMRRKACEILVDLLNEGFIEPIEEDI